MSDFVATNLITKPTSNNRIRKLDDSSSDDDDKKETFEDESMSLVEFSRLYQIHGIQIFDVLLIYIAVYYFVYIYLEKSLTFTFLVLLVVTIIVVMKNNITK
uniref:Uncharacterized protein n=1 Tax=viral metagenome TaxID=1070528 RepID=A0A6C0C966_9ZZZZ